MEEMFKKFIEEYKIDCVETVYQQDSVNESCVDFVAELVEYYLKSQQKEVQLVKDYTGIKFGDTVVNIGRDIAFTYKNKRYLGVVITLSETTISINNIVCDRRLLGDGSEILDFNIEDCSKFSKIYDI